MSVLINNSYYRVELTTSVDANGGNNVGGRVVRIVKKLRDRQFIEVPLNVWVKVIEAVDVALKLPEPPACTCEHEDVGYAPYIHVPGCPAKRVAR